MTGSTYERLLESFTRHVGERVRVKHAGDKYQRYDIKGCFGTIIRWYGNDNIAVRLDGLSNRSSQYGYFYFSKWEIEIIENEKMEENTMAINNNAITNYLNIARVRFTGDSEPSDRLYANYIPDLAVGDLCAVAYGFKNEKPLVSVAEVVEIIGSIDAKVDCEIVSKVDTLDYDIRVDRRKKAAELKAKMQERAKQLQDIVLYQTLAKDDPEMAQLLADYTNLGSV